MRQRQHSTTTEPMSYNTGNPKVTETLMEKEILEQSIVRRNTAECPLTIKESLRTWRSTELQDKVRDITHTNNCQAETDSCANTPRHQFHSVRSHADSETGIETVHHRKGLYDDVIYADSVDLKNRPTISLGDINEGINLEALLYGPRDDENIEPAQLSATTIASYRFEQPRPFWHLFNAITSDDVYMEADDWGIDRSIYTRYARSGFFADCHIADSVHHGEYLSLPDCEEFAECRIPLVVCIISTSRETRINEIQKGIIPLAVNLLDRYMVKHKSSMDRLVSITTAHIDGPSSGLSSKQGSLANSLSAADVASLDASSVTKGLKEKYKHDNLIKLCFKYLSDDAFVSRKSTMQQNPFSDDNSADADSCYEENSDDAAGEYRFGSKIKLSIVYNFVAAACFFIADRYNGLSNTSVKALLVTWESISHAFTKTRDAAKFIRENRSMSLSIIMSFMFDIYFVLDYKLTTPFPCHMVQDLILSTTDFQYSQSPSEHNLYQNLAAILARIAYVDDSFHKFRPSIVTLAIYSVIRKLAVHNQEVEDEHAWLLVDETDAEISNCSELLVKTLQQYVDTDILDVLTQPVYMKHQTDELFGHLFDDLCDLDATKLKNLSSTLMTLC
ncbi:uncharacterized protein BXIN_1369 [Babesia sp. Xinjiang]|uniref:uncharacterized protein n=1 Tax=Babesia sp. Xinjiang TaxID=462227 RepID=UPI000A224476|nr:uncharacterized protein BXIN_1369 [Babesia sp. Xinjiang]ORM40211.1 hypothetical protein BXIN_1369 [Babesia sp. Xinjiang]